MCTALFVVVHSVYGLGGIERSCRLSTRRTKNRTVAYRLATNRRKTFDRSFAAGMDATTAYLVTMEAAAACKSQVACEKA